MNGCLKLDKKPLFTTGVAANITGINPKTLINYDSAGLVDVERNEQGRRLYSKDNLFTLLLIQYLIQEKGLTFAGVKCVMELLSKVSENDSDVLSLVLSDSQLKKLLNKINF